MIGNGAQEQLIQDQREANETMVKATLRALESTEDARVGQAHAEALTRQLLLAQQALAASEAQFRVLIESMPQLAWTAGPDGCMDFFNRGWHEYTGTSLEQMKERGWDSAHDPKELQRVKESWRRSLETGVAFECSFPLRGADGRHRWFLCRAHPLRDSAGHITRWVGTCTDVDDQRHAEERLVASLEAERHLAEFRERFIGILGHDLRNPLSAISVASDRLIQRGHLDDQDVKLVARVVRSSQRMARMISRVLDLTRARLGGGLPIEPRPTDLGEVCRNVVEEFEGAQLELDGDLNGNWDEDRLVEVLSNLVGNAFEHAAPATPIRIKAHSEGSQVVVDVCNQGPAIPAALLPFIFEPFRRGKQHEKSASGNLGLGLYIARQIIGSHGGTLEAHCAAGTTHFVMRLPRQPHFEAAQ